MSVSTSVVWSLHSEDGKCVVEMGRCTSVSPTVPEVNNRTEDRKPHQKNDLVREICVIWCARYVCHMCVIYMCVHVCLRGGVCACVRVCE